MAGACVKYENTFRGYKNEMKRLHGKVMNKVNLRNESINTKIARIEIRFKESRIIRHIASFGGLSTKVVETSFTHHTRKNSFN